MANFFYDNQIRRFLLQFTRIFSHFEVEYGVDANNNITLIRVPIRWGDASKNVQTILQENSTSALPTAPLMTFYVHSLKPNRKNTQSPSHIQSTYVRQREWNDASQTYEQTEGNAFTVERPMPVPYELGITLDCWTTNTNMKMQLLEQILTLFNPALQIQSTDNFLDWTSLSTLELTDVNWSSRSVPNTSENIDIATLKFSMPIWISPPARVSAGGIIHKVISSVYDSDGKLVDAINNDDLLLGTRIKVMPHSYQVLLLNNELQLLPANIPMTDGVFDPLDLESSDLSWHAVMDEYGALNDGITQIRLSQADGNEIIGTVSYIADKQSILTYNIDIDTIPSNTLNPIDAVIDPLISGPGAGLVAASLGQRYLLTEDIGNSADNSYAQAWFGTQELVAVKNDIIEFDGTNWLVSFSPSANLSDTQYVTNITTNIQYKSINGEWFKSYEGIYAAGDWGIVI